MTHSNLKESALLVRHITLLEALEVSHGVLDLAAPLVATVAIPRRGLPVVFADIDGEKLASLTAVDVPDPAMMRLEVDFERKTNNPLAGKTFDAILIFNYLHRSNRQDQAGSQARRAVFYETFTEQHADSDVR